MELPLLMYQRSSCERESTAESEIDAGAEDGEELGKPRGMRGPGGAGDEVAVSDGLGDGEIVLGAASEGDLGGGRRIVASFLFLQNSLRRQDFVYVIRG